MKRIIFALAMLISNSSLMAFQGVYVGGSLGAHLTEGQQSGDVGMDYQTSLSSTGTLDIQRNLFDHDIAGMVFLGYRFHRGCGYFGVEGFAQMSKGSLHSHNDFSQYNNELAIFNYTSSSTDGRLEILQCGLDFLPGWAFHPTLLAYGRLGVGAARTHVKVSSTNDLTHGGNTGSLTFSPSKKRTRATFRAGGGIEQALTKRVSLRADYIYTDCGKTNIKDSKEESFASGSQIINPDTSLHIYDHALLLGLTYHFSCLNLDCGDLFCHTSAFRGFYVGGALGGGDGEVHQHGGTVFSNPISIPYQTPGLIDSGSYPRQLYNNQFQTTGYLGYGRTWKCFYLGGELFGTKATHAAMHVSGTFNYFIGSLNSFSEPFEITVKAAKWQWGLDLRPGFHLTPLTLLYGRVGVSAAEIKLRSKAVFYSYSSPLGLGNKYAESAWKAAFRLGLGLEYLLTSNLHLRADYVFTNFGVLSFHNQSIFSTGDQNAPIYSVIPAGILTNA